MDHIIRRQLLELTLDGHQPPFDLQNRLSDQYYNMLLPILEKWFDQLAGDDEVLFIDRLVVDLGVISRRDFDDRLLKQRLIEKLYSPDMVRAVGATETSPDSAAAAREAGQEAEWGALPGAARRPTGKAASGVTRGPATGAVQRRSARHNAFEQWVWYMEKGYLPWSLLRVTPEWEYKVLEMLATDHPAITRLRSLITNQPATLARIVLQHDDIFLMRLTEILTTVVQSPLPQALQELRRLLIFAVNLEGKDNDTAYAPMPAIPTPEKAWQDVLVLAASLGRDGSTQALTHRLLTHYWADYPQFLPELQDYLTTRPIARDLMEPPDTPPAAPAPAVATPTEPTTHPATGAATGLTGSQQPAAVDRQTDTGRQQSDREDAAITPPTTIAQTATTITPTKAILVPPDMPAHLMIGQLPEEGLFLLNAGIILTHPFLSHLFRHSGLLANGKFIADIARQKAIHLLHYLATGRTIAEEFELVTAKILCGCPLEYPIEKQSVITTEELKECDSLLEGLLSHWGVKNITVEGLRGNFLSRSGKLSPKDDRLHLVIEKHAVDILVRTYPFPWNMSIIKLPWLHQAIHLDW